MSDKSDDGQGDGARKNRTSSSSENISESSLGRDFADGLNDAADSDIDSEAFATDQDDRKKESLSSSSSRVDLKLNFASSDDSADPGSGAETDVKSTTSAKSQSDSKPHLEEDEIPNLMDDDDFADNAGRQDSDDDGGSFDDEKNEADDEFIMKQLEKLVARRNRQDNEARLRWLAFLREQKEAQEERKQFQAYWDRRHQDDKNLWRDKDFANAIYKMSRAGYKGEHGHFEVPEEIIQQMNALYMQVTVGDYDGNNRLKCAEEWKKLKGKTKIDCQREFIKMANRTITMYGWNPPEGWM